MLIAVIDGQGGGIGKAIVEQLKGSLCDGNTVLALGINPLATSSMLKAGADLGASGENAIVVNAPKADVIVGAIGIIAANSMLGEVTPAMAEAIASSSAEKVLIPTNRCGITVAGIGSDPPAHYIEKAVEIVKRLVGQDKSQSDCQL